MARRHRRHHLLERQMIEGFHHARAWGKRRNELGGRDVTEIEELNAGGSYTLMALVASMSTRPSHGPRDDSVSCTVVHGTASRTSDAAAASASVAALAGGTSFVTTSAKLSGPRGLRSATRCPAAVKNPPTPALMVPAPGTPTV